jgi:hypothetical protein
MTEERRRRAPLEPDEDNPRAESEETTDREGPERDASEESAEEGQRTGGAPPDERQGKTEEAG